VPLQHHDAGLHRQSSIPVWLDPGQYQLRCQTAVVVSDSSTLPRAFGVLTVAPTTMATRSSTCEPMLNVQRTLVNACLVSEGQTQLVAFKSPRTITSHTNNKHFVSTLVRKDPRPITRSTIGPVS
jgi:hypothetical protein